MNIDRLIDECNKFTDVPNSMLRWVYIALENVKYKATPDEFSVFTDFLRKKLVSVNEYADDVVLVFYYEVYTTKFKVFLAICQDYEITETKELDIIKVEV